MMAKRRYVVLLMLIAGIIVRLVLLAVFGKQSFPELAPFWQSTGLDFLTLMTIFLCLYLGIPMCALIEMDKNKGKSFKLRKYPFTILSCMMVISLLGLGLYTLFSAS